MSTTRSFTSNDLREHPDAQENPQPTAPSPVQPGDVVQIHLTEKQAEAGYGGLIMTVTHVREWGVVGFIVCPNPQGGQPVPVKYQVDHSEYTRIGHQAFEFVKAK